MTLQKSPPLVSILMPFKDTAQFLGQCIESIQSQDYNNWELLAIDDGSTDGSLSLLRSFAGRDPRIQIKHNSGSGIIPALRTAYAHCQGLYVTRMDSDDIMGPKRLSQMVSDLQESGPGHLALGQVRYFSERGISDGYARYEQWLNRLTTTGDNFSEIYKECVIPSPCWMVGRQDLDTSEAFTPGRYPEDYDLCFRFYRSGLQCIPSSHLLHYWRDYDSRTSRTSNHYAQNYFLEIKTHYFLELHRDTDRPLFVWGAGFKGKKVSRLLLEAGMPFNWVCDNPKKIGKRIYGQLLSDYREIGAYPAPQSIITVANEAAQAAIRDFLSRQNAKPMEDFFFFC